MSVVVIGLNHRTAPLDILERMIVNDATLPKALHELCGREHLSESVLLSTCNRTEVYAVAEKFHGGYHDIRSFLSELAFLAPEDFSDHLYVHYDEAAVAHLFSVAAGLDTEMLGESEILGQVGTAWADARREGAAGASLNLVFRHALEVGKRVRTDTGIGRGVASISQAAVAMAAERLGDLAGRRVLVLGAGDMADGMTAALARGGVADVAVANRTRSSAAALAARVGGRAVSLSELPEHLVDVDLLLTSTGATSVMVGHSDLALALERRAGRPLLIVDIAVPRDVDPSAGDLPGVTLLDMDDLRAYVEVGVGARRRESARAQRILDEELDRFRTLATAREVAPLVAVLRERAEVVRRGEINRHARAIEGLDERQRDALEAVTRGVVAKLLHQPTVRLKDAAGTSRGDRLAEALRDLFDL